MTDAADRWNTGNSAVTGAARWYVCKGPLREWETEQVREK